MTDLPIYNATLFIILLILNEFFINANVPNLEFRSYINNFPSSNFKRACNLEILIKLN